MSNKYTWRSSWFFYVIGVQISVYRSSLRFHIFGYDMNFKRFSIFSIFVCFIALIFNASIFYSISISFCSSCCSRWCFISLSRGDFFIKSVYWFLHFSSSLYKIKKSSLVYGLVFLSISSLSFFSSKTNFFFIISLLKFSWISFSFLNFLNFFKAKYPRTNFWMKFAASFLLWSFISEVKYG